MISVNINGIEIENSRAAHARADVSIDAASAVVYTAPADSSAMVTINLCNRETTDYTFKIAVSPNTTPGNSDWIDYDTRIIAHGAIEREGIVLGPNENLIIGAFSVVAPEVLPID